MDGRFFPKKCSQSISVDKASAFFLMHEQDEIVNSKIQKKFD